LGASAPGVKAGSGEAACTQTESGEQGEGLRRLRGGCGGYGIRDAGVGRVC